MPAPTTRFDEARAGRQHQMRPAAVLAEQQRARALRCPRLALRQAPPDLAGVGSRLVVEVAKRAEEPPAIELAVAEDATAPAAGAEVGAPVQARRQSVSRNWLPLVVVQQGLVVRLAVASVAEAADWPKPHAQGRAGPAAELLVVAEPVQGVAGPAAGRLVVVQVQPVSVRQRTQHGQCPARAECAAHP